MEHFATHKLSKTTTSLPSKVSDSIHCVSVFWITNGSGTPVQHLQYMPYGEPLVNEKTTSYEERFTFTGKERDSETGFSYFGARYYDSDLMTSWLSVDPMADKYPNISPYAYCAWNPVKLVDPNGEDWYETEAGKIQYTTKIISKSDFEKSNIKGRYLGKIYTSKNKYYSLFGQIIDKNSTNGKITAKLDEAMIAFAEYREATINYTYSYRNPDEPIQRTTDFANICKFIDRFGTTSDNIHDHYEMGTYAGIADIYFHVTGNNMDGKFKDWTISNRITGNNGYFATPPGKYLTITKNSVGGVMVGLNFYNQKNVNSFMNQFYTLFPKAK